MSEVLEYKGYHAEITPPGEDSDGYYGHVTGLRDLLTFKSESEAGIVAEFHETIDEYLADCKELGKTPDSESDGKFELNIEPNLHRLLRTFASKDGKTLDEFIGAALKDYAEKQYNVRVRAFYDPN